MTTPETPPDAELRQRIADAVRAAACTGDCDSTEEECARQRIQPVVWHWGVLAEVSATPDQIADALLPLVAAERADAVRGAADWLTAEYPGPNVDRAVRRAADRLLNAANALTGPQ